MVVSFLSNGVNPSLPDASKVVNLTSYERIGVIIMAVSGTTSCILVSSLLLMITFTALFPWRQQSSNSSVPFTSKQVAVFVTCLLASDLIQSISGVLQAKWAAEHRIYEGVACSIQAATLVMGDLGSTVWSCVIAAHTFSGIALGKQWSRQVVISTVVIGWTFVITLTAVGPLVLPSANAGPFFSIAGTWCFISSEYALARLGIHYIPLFTAAAVIAAIYVLLFLVLLGTVSFSRSDTDIHFLPLSKAISQQRVVVAKRMLWYPVVYLTCILPIAVTRLVGFQEENVPEVVWVFGMVLLFSLGAADAVVYATTRHIIKPSSLTASPIVFNNTQSSWDDRVLGKEHTRQVDSRMNETIQLPSPGIDGTSAHLTTEKRAKCHDSLRESTRIGRSQLSF